MSVEETSSPCVPGARVTAGPELRGKCVVLVAASAEHVLDLRHILHTPEVRLRRVYGCAGDRGAGGRFTSPQLARDDRFATRFAAVPETTVIGMAHCGQGEPSYRHAMIEVFVHPIDVQVRNRPRRCGHRGSPPGAGSQPSPSDD